MIGNIFAFCMIAMLVSTGTVLSRWGKCPTFRATLTGILLFLVCFVALAVLTPAHACRRGGSMLPELLGALLAGVVFAAIPIRKVKTPVMIALIVSGYALTFWGMELVHDAPYVGNPRWDDELQRISSFSVKTARDGLVAVSTNYPDTILPPGWVEESWRQVTGEDLFIGGRLGYMSGTVSHFWHSWFTGIYRLEERPNGVWCPGGTIPHCAENLEIRDREEPNQKIHGTQ